MSTPCLLDNYQCKASFSTARLNDAPNCISPYQGLAKGNINLIDKKFASANSLQQLGRAPVPNTVDSKKLQLFQRRAMQAAMNSKIFVIDCGSLPALREALTRRGWVQKLSARHMQQFLKIPDTLLVAHADNNNIYERILMTNLLRKHLPNFLWTHRNYNRSDYDNSRYYSKITRGRPTDFVRKTDLEHIFSQVYWFLPEEDVSIVHLRGYAITDTAERSAFVEDYNLTICTNIIYYLFTLSPMDQAFAEDGSVTTDCLNFALTKVRASLHKKMNDDIDKLNEYEFADVYSIYDKIFQDIMHAGATMRQGTGRRISDLMAEINRLGPQLLEHYPNLPIDGFHNVWILKPASCNRGTGIQVMNSLPQILQYLDDHRTRVYVVQKYLERPLLIYNTKFDIRQYFLILMEENVVNLWIYKNCYLKLSGHEFNLADLRECIHLTNHTVQKKYMNGDRNHELPPHNMWTLAEFKAYLAKIDKGALWDTRIFPGFINTIKTAVTAGLDDMVVDRNSFELYGADFMVTEFGDPVLLEINSVPDLSPSTVSTRVVCAAVCEDLVKVLIDYQKDKLSSTGDFELIARIDVPAISSYTYDLTVQGEEIATPRSTQKLSTSTDSLDVIQRPKTIASAAEHVVSKPKKKGKSARRNLSVLNAQKEQKRNPSEMSIKMMRNSKPAAKPSRPLKNAKLPLTASATDKSEFKIIRIDNNVMSNGPQSLGRKLIAPMVSSEAVSRIVPITKTKKSSTSIGYLQKVGLATSAEKVPPPPMTPRRRFGPSINKKKDVVIQ